VRTPPPDTSSNTWGEIITIPTPPQTFRFTFLNIQGLVSVDPHSHKHQQIKTAIQETESDATGLVELNLNLDILGPTFQWAEQFRNLHRNHSVHTVNRHDSSKKRILFGGAAQITVGACSHRVIKSGLDESGMGRWVWTLYAGCNNKKL
jgi:hypothetical protein